MRAGVGEDAPRMHETGHRHTYLGDRRCCVLRTQWHRPPATLVGAAAGIRAPCGIEVLRDHHDVECRLGLPSHGVDVGQRVRGGDRAEHEGVIGDGRGKKSGGLDQGDVIARGRRRRRRSKPTSRLGSRGCMNPRRALRARPRHLAPHLAHAASLVNFTSSDIAVTLPETPSGPLRQVASGLATQGAARPASPLSTPPPRHSPYRSPISHRTDASPRGSMSPVHTTQHVDTGASRPRRTPSIVAGIGTPSTRATVSRADDVADRGGGIEGAVSRRAQDALGPHARR